MVLSLIVFGILAVSLIITWRLGRQQKAAEGDFDSKITQELQEHVYLKNPIFFSYGIFFVLLLLIIVIVAVYLSR